MNDEDSGRLERRRCGLKTKGNDEMMKTAGKTETMKSETGTKETSDNTERY